MSLASSSSSNSSAMSPSDFISLLEADSPLINSLTVNFTSSESFRSGAVIIFAGSSGGNHLIFDNPIQWEQLGRGMGRSTKLQLLDLTTAIDVDTFLPESIQCLEAFYDGLKDNTSVRRLSIHLVSDRDTHLMSVFDLNHFMTKNTQMEVLSILCGGLLGPDEGTVIELAVRNSLSLEKLDMCCTFHDNRVFEQILSACSNIRKLRLECSQVNKCTAVADFLRNRATELQHLALERIVRGGFSIIAESVANNTSLEELEMYGSVSTDDMDIFERSLCDTASLDSIKNSNHTLLKISPAKNFSQRALDCVKLNRNKNKEEVVRQKIAKYDFAGDFDVSPFANMPLSAIPNIMGMIGGDDLEAKESLQCNAIFKLLKAIPDLYNVGSRKEKLEDSSEK